MNDPIEHAWSAAVDSADAGIPDLPTDAPAGVVFEKDGRRWLRVIMLHGKIGSRWAYWRDREFYWVVGDPIFNADAHHFAGMFSEPSRGGANQKAWIMVEPKIREIPPEAKEVEPSPPSERYERSKEVFDVATGKTEILP